MKPAQLRERFMKHSFFYLGRKKNCQNLPSKSRTIWNDTILFACNMLIVGVFFVPLTTKAAEVTEQLHNSPDSRNSFQLRDRGDQLLHLAKRELKQGNPSGALDFLLQTLEIYHSVKDIKGLPINKIYVYKNGNHSCVGREGRSAIAPKGRVPYATRGRSLTFLLPAFCSKFFFN